MEETLQAQLCQKPRIVILISGRGSNMKAIIDASLMGDIDAEVVLVISNRADAGGLNYAREQKIPTKIISHKEFDSRESFDAALAKDIMSADPDLICLAGFMRVLTAGFVRQFPNKILNIHPSLLPKYKGLNTHQRAIDSGDNEAGCSVHIVTEDLDDGPVIAQTKVDIYPNDTSDMLAERVLSVEHETYIHALKLTLRDLANVSRGVS